MMPLTRFPFRRLGLFFIFLLTGSGLFANPGDPNDSLRHQIDSLQKSISHLLTAMPQKDSVMPEVISATPIQNDNQDACLNDYIQVTVRNLAALYNSPGHANDAIVLYLDGIAMHGINPLFDNMDSTLVFQLVRDSTTCRAWDVFYESPREHVEFMTVSVGYEHDKALPTRVNKVKQVDRRMKIVLVHGTAWWIALLSIIGLIIGFYYLAIKTNVIRDKCSPTIKNAPYSLARFQLLFWTLLSLISFIFIWAVTLEIPEITTSTLILLGMSVGTSAGARLIDFNQEDNSHRHQNSESQGFWKDILSDGEGISIYRLQMFAWMIIVGVYFLNVSYTYLYMPQLDNTLLALMGISSGTYVGLKLPENKNAAQQQTADATQQQQQQQPAQPQNTDPAQQ